MLLVEDNLVNQKVAVRFLERLGCRVHVRKLYIDDHLDSLDDETLQRVMNFRGVNAGMCPGDVRAGFVDYRYAEQEGSDLWGHSFWSFFIFD